MNQDQENRKLIISEEFDGQGPPLVPSAEAVGEAEGVWLHVGDYKMFVGLEKDKVRDYYRKFISQHYADLPRDGLRDLRVKAIDAMLQYYVDIAEVDCFYEVTNLQNDLIMLDKAYYADGAKRASLMGEKPPPKSYQKREAVAYKTDVEFCFEVADPSLHDRVLDLLKQVCRDVDDCLGHGEVLTKGIPEVFCGSCRDVILKGNADLNRIWINRLVNHLVKDNQICRVGSGLHDVWSAANQAFLKVDKKTYAKDHFSKAPLKKHHNHTIKIDKIIDERFRDLINVDLKMQQASD